MCRILLALVVSCLMGLSESGSTSLQSALGSEADIVSPTPDNQSTFLKNYSPASTIKQFSIENSGAQESAPAGGVAGRNCAFHDKQFVSLFVIRSGTEDPLMADIEREIKYGLAQQGRIVMQSGHARKGFKIDYAAGRSKGTVLVEPLETIDPTIVGGPGGIARGQTAVKLHIWLAETWYKAPDKACGKL